MPSLPMITTWKEKSVRNWLFFAHSEMSNPDGFLA